MTTERQEVLYAQVPSRHHFISGPCARMSFDDGKRSGLPWRSVVLGRGERHFTLGNMPGMEERF